MANYKVGEMLILGADVELKDFFGNKTVKTLAKEGTKLWIGADNLAHYQNGTIQPLAKDSTVQGYDDKGIAERILLQLKADLPLDEMCEEHKVSSEDIKESIEDALDELGFY